MSKLPPFFDLTEEVRSAIAEQRALVALESTVITHGLPYPENLGLARDMEAEVRAGGAIPATIALVGGRVRVGLADDELAHLAEMRSSHKISSREIGPAAALGWWGGTTVAGTLAVARQVGIRVFATGGIGGVHRDAPFDISADLPELARSQVVVVCAGAKSILDLAATLEYLETLGVPVVGYQTDEFPAFFTRTSGLKVSARADTGAQAAAIARCHWAGGGQSAILLTVPPPEQAALAEEKVHGAIEQALLDAQQQNVHGQAVTPFLLARVSELTGRASLAANLALLKNNARVAAIVARDLS